MVDFGHVSGSEPPPDRSSRPGASSWAPPDHSSWPGAFRCSCALNTSLLPGVHRLAGLAVEPPRPSRRRVRVRVPRPHRYGGGLHPFTQHPLRLNCRVRMGPSAFLQVWPSPKTPRRHKTAPPGVPPDHSSWPGVLTSAFPRCRRTECGRPSFAHENLGDISRRANTFGFRASSNPRGIFGPRYRNPCHTFSQFGKK